jgi:hypothetical protein
MMATVIAVLLAVVALAFVLQPLLAKRRGHARVRPAGTVPSDTEIEAMIAAYRRDRVDCPTCGLRPEPNATFCSECGRPLPAESALDSVEASEGDPDRNQGRR